MLVSDGISRTNTSTSTDDAYGGTTGSLSAYYASDYGKPKRRTANTYVGLWNQVLLQSAADERWAGEGW